MENSNEFKPHFKNYEKGMQSTLDRCFGDSPSQGLLNNNWNNGSLGENGTLICYAYEKELSLPHFQLKNEHPKQQYVYYNIPSLKYTILK